ncbi:hypothetical protein N8911_02005 [bacterium]|jgi:hypothetical protein|nr:hypothetical protein [bacterium]
MEKGLKKITASVLITATLFFATLAVLSIWDIIQIEKMFQKSFFTLIVIFCAAGIMLFIFTNFFKKPKNDNETHV